MQAPPWVEPWGDFLNALLVKGSIVLYEASIAVLTLYALWYIASLAAFLAAPEEAPGPAGNPGPAGGAWPRVAVVYPVYNDYEVLSSIEAALRLDYPDYFIVVVDDSSDESLSERVSLLAKRHRGRLIHLRRRGRRGLKAGALNEAARLASRLGARYILVLDADFEPSPGLLRRLVARAESEGADIVQGHQAHRKGARDAFGLLYRAGMGGATLFMAGRRRLGMFPIFTGSVALLRLDAVLDVPFREGSISEDWRWTIDYALNYGLTRYTVDPAAEAVGSVPRDARSYWRQQLRWSAGTTMEAIDTFWHVLFTNRLPAPQKLGYLLQALFYTQGFFVYTATLVPIALLLSGVKPPVWPIGLYLWFAAIASLLIAGGVAERLSVREQLTVALVLIPFIYYTSLIHAIGVLRALRRRGGWVVTPKRGEHESEYAR
jgi:cellulose synthase/poly-beta-1,6-N-acetylglucosamine synthase-like glycosyltransferase